VPARAEGGRTAAHAAAALGPDDAMTGIAGSEASHGARCLAELLGVEPRCDA
jgi:hypothetical protein